MAEELARGQITIIDLNDAKSANVFLKANKALTQVYSKDGASYVPSFVSGTNNPSLQITPEVFVSGSSSNLVSQLQSVTWTINDKSVSDFGGATVSTAAPWTLTINKNMANDSVWHIVFSAKWLDSDTGLLTNVKSDITFAKVVNSGTLAFAQVVGQSVIKQDTDSVTLTGQLIRGGQSNPDTTDVSYQWYERTPTGDKALTGETSANLTLAASRILNISSFFVKIKDNDPSSGTAGQTFTSPIFNVTDMSDPYSVRMDASNGTTLINGQGSTVVTATLLQGGVPIDDSALNKFVFNWTAVNKDGGSLTIPTAAFVSGSPNKLKVDRSIVNRKSTFFCGVSIAQNPTK